MADLPPMRGTGALDLTAFLEGMDFSRFHVRLVILACCVTFFDGLDFGLIAYAAPYIRDELQLSGDALGVVFSSGVAGQIVGSMLCAYVADRIGRRPVLVFCTVAAALLTFAMGLAGNVEQFIVLRFLGGIAIGGLLPVIWALTIEAMPKSRRATVVALIMLGFSLGGSASAPLTNLIAPEHGWHWVYFACGILTFAVALWLLVALPESARFLASRGAPPERIVPVLRRLHPGFDGRGVTSFHLSDERRVEGNFTPADLFRGPFAWITPLIWGAYFSSSVAAFLNASWGPIFLEELGVTREGAALIGSVAGLLGAIASVLLLRVTEIRGPRWIAIFPLLAAPLLFLIGSGWLAHAMLVPAIFLGIVLMGGGHASVISITSIFYPSGIRSNAGGWASAVAKIGGVLGPIIGAQFVGDSQGVLRSFLLVSSCMLAIAFCVLALARFARGLEGSGRAGG